MSKRILKKDEIQTAGALKTVEVLCPEFGPDAIVLLRELTADAALEFGQKVNDGEDKEAMLTWIIVSAINEDGSPLFEEADRPWLGQKGMSFVMRLGKEALKLNGLDKAGDEDRVKN